MPKWRRNRATKVYRLARSWPVITFGQPVTDYWLTIPVDLNCSERKPPASLVAFSGSTGWRASCEVETEESYTSLLYPQATVECLCSVTGMQGGEGGGGTSQKARPQPIEEKLFIQPSKSQLYLMSFPLLLAEAYISSILMAHGRRHRST